MTLPANIELIAVASGVACVAGLVLAVVGLVGITRPRGPVSRGPPYRRRSSRRVRIASTHASRSPGEKPSAPGSW